MTGCGFERTFSRKNILQSCTPIWAMKRVKSNYHALHVLKTAEPRLRKALITNCNTELENCVSECVLNLLNGYTRLSGCKTRKLKKHTSALRKVADRHVPLSEKKRLIVQRGGFLLPLQSAIQPKIASLILKPG